MGSNDHEEPDIESKLRIARFRKVVEKLVECGDIEVSPGIAENVFNRRGVVIVIRFLK